MKRIIIGALIAISASSAQANTYNYVCKDHGKSFPLKVDDAQSTLEWQGTTYRIRENENCAKFGWHAEKNGTSFDFCTATQGGGYIQQNGHHIQDDIQDGNDIPCNLKRR